MPSPASRCPRPVRSRRTPRADQPVATLPARPRRDPDWPHLGADAGTATCPGRGPGAAGRGRGPRAGRPGRYSRHRSYSGPARVWRCVPAARPRWASRPTRRIWSRATTSSWRSPSTTPTTSGYGLAVLRRSGDDLGRWLAADDAHRTLGVSVPGKATDPTRGRRARSCAGAGTPTRPSGVHVVACDGPAREQPGVRATAGPQGVSRGPTRSRPTDAMPNAAGLVGAHRSRRYGDGGELAGIRRFGPGDRLRRIDWRTSLRTGELHIAQTLSDRDAELVLLLDVLHEAGVCRRRRRSGQRHRHDRPRGGRDRPALRRTRRPGTHAGVRRTQPRAPCRHRAPPLPGGTGMAARRAAGRGSARPDGGDLPPERPAHGRVARRPDAAGRPPQRRDAGPAGA